MDRKPMHQNHSWPRCSGPQVLDGVVWRSHVPDRRLRQGRGKHNGCRARFRFHRSTDPVALVCCGTKSHELFFGQRRPLSGSSSVLFERFSMQLLKNVLVHGHQDFVVFASDTSSSERGVTIELTKRHDQSNTQQNMTKNDRVAVALRGPADVPNRAVIDACSFTRTLLLHGANLRTTSDHH